MSQTRILCNECGFPLTFCACGRSNDGPRGDLPPTTPPPALLPVTEPFSLGVDNKTVPPPAGTQTPRTDAFIETPNCAYDGMWVDFSRELERELSRQKATVELLLWAREEDRKQLADAIKERDEQADHLREWTAFAQQASSQLLCLPCREDILHATAALRQQLQGPEAAKKLP